MQEKYLEDEQIIAFAVSLIYCMLSPWVDYLLSTDYMPVIVLGPGYSVVIRTDKVNSARFCCNCGGPGMGTP